MTKIKLKEWADRHNLSYLTANRHFHAGMIPGAVQLDSGTILVEDDSPEQTMAGNSANNDAMSLFLRKTVEFSKNNSSVEDFAAYVISNFQLKLNTVPEGPRYSRNKPKADEVQKHFQQFLPDKESIEHLKAVKTLLKEGRVAGDVVPAASAPSVAAAASATDLTPVTEEVLQGLLRVSPSTPDVHMYGNVTEGLVSRSVDFDTTPQQINYTGSTNQAFSTSSLVTEEMQVNSSHLAGFPQGVAMNGVFLSATTAGAAVPFQPTQKELLSVTQVIDETTDNLSETDARPRKRGRKPSKKR